MVRDNILSCSARNNIAVLEITIGQWPFSNQFQHQNPFWLANFTVIGWQSITYKLSYFQKNGRPISDPSFYHCIVGIYLGHVNILGWYLPVGIRA